jgi:anti-anti-sigma factor
MTSSELQGFHIREEIEPDRIVRLTLCGDLDLATVGQFEQRISEAATGAYGVRLDLSQLRFIDLCGLRAVTRAVASAHRIGAMLEVDQRVSRRVARLIGLVGAEDGFWPPVAPIDREHARTRHTGQRRRALPRARRCTAGAAPRH